MKRDPPIFLSWEDRKKLKVFEKTGDDLLVNWGDIKTEIILKQEANNGILSAQINLASSYFFRQFTNEENWPTPSDLFGKIFPRPLESSMLWILKSLEKGSHTGMLLFGMYICIALRDIDFGLPKIETIANLGHIRAQIMTGFFYYKTYRYELAIYWIKRASFNGMFKTKEVLALDIQTIFNGYNAVETSKNYTYPKLPHVSRDIAKLFVADGYIEKKALRDILKPKITTALCMLRLRNTVGIFVPLVSKTIMLFIYKISI